MIIVDNSTLAATQRCDTEAALRYVLGFTASEDSAPPRAGTAVHEAMAAWFKSGGNARAAMTALEQDYKAWADEFVPDPDDRLGWHNVQRIMTQWFASHRIERFPVQIDPTLVEVGFALPLSGDVVFVGRMDGIGHDDRGAWGVVDHKSAARLDDKWRNTHRMAAQMTGYTWSAKHHVSAPVIGAYINGIEMAKLPESNRKCRDHGVQYAECGALHARTEILITQRPPHIQEEWQRTALDLAARFAALGDTVKTLDDIHKVRTQGQFTGACAQCQFSLYCREGRPTSGGQVGALLRHEPWEPYKHAFKETQP